MTTLTTPIAEATPGRTSTTPAGRLAHHLRDLLADVAVLAPEHQPGDATLAAAVNHAFASVDADGRPAWSVSPTDPRPVLLRALQHALHVVASDARRTT